MEDVTDGITVDLSKSHGLSAVSVSELKALKEDLSRKECGRKRYFHELLDGSRIILPSPAPVPRNEELEARVQKLRAEQMNKEYMNMVRDVSMPKGHGPSEDFQGVRTVNAQLTIVINFVLTVVGSFVFAYKAVEYGLLEASIALKVLAGLMAAIVVAIADLFFVLRSL